MTVTRIVSTILCAATMLACQTEPAPPPKKAEPFARTRPQVTTPEVSSGHTLFLEYCVQCHRMNGQGGRVGPELNHHRGVDWSDEQLAELIKNARDFGLRNTMPSFLHLSDADLGALVAYLRAMETSREL